MRFHFSRPTGPRVFTIVVTIVFGLALSACSAEKPVKDSLADAEAALAKNEPASVSIEAKNALQRDPESAAGAPPARSGAAAHRRRRRR